MQLLTLLEGLTDEQKATLKELGIPKQRRSDWKAGRCRPTAAQLMVLAMVTNTDPQPLIAWLAEQEANPAQRAMFREVAAGRSVKAAIAIAVSLAAGTSHGFAQWPSAFQPARDRANTVIIVVLTLAEHQPFVR